MQRHTQFREAPDDVKVMLAYFRPLDSSNWYRAFVDQGVRVSLVFRDTEATSQAHAQQPDALLVDGRLQHSAALKAAISFAGQQSQIKTSVYAIVRRAPASVGQQYLAAGVTGYYFDDQDHAWVASQIIAGIRRIRRFIHFGAQATVPDEAEFMLAPVLRYLQEYTFQLPRGRELRDTLGIDMAELQRLVRQWRGVSVADWIRHEKMRYASYLVTSTADPLADIASTLGYSSRCNFSTAFRLYHGMSPRNFRRLSPKDGVQNPSQARMA